jgi:hypothetical protein
VAKFVAKDFSVTIDSNDVSTNVASVTLSQTAEDVETTAFGTNSRTRIGGLKDGEVSFDFHQDFGSGGIDSIFQPLLGTNVQVEVKPTSEAVSATNPSYSFEVLVAEYSPLDSSVGDLATFSVTLPISGDVTRTETV